MTTSGIGGPKIQKLIVFAFCPPTSGPPPNLSTLLLIQYSSSHLPSLPCFFSPCFSSSLFCTTASLPNEDFKENILKKKKSYEKNMPCSCSHWIHFLVCCKCLLELLCAVFSHTFTSCAFAVISVTGAFWMQAQYKC